MGRIENAGALRRTGAGTRGASRNRWILPFSVLVCACVVVAATGFLVTLHATATVQASMPGFVPVAHASATFYVSPQGDDGDSGTSSAPFRTLARAQLAVRKALASASGNVVVYLESGIYRLSSPLQLTVRDSGRGGGRVIWTSAPGATAIIAGSKRITGWQLSDRSRNIWSAPVPKGLRTRQIYVNGMRSTLASGPPPVRLARTKRGYLASKPTMSKWRNAHLIDFVYTSELGLHVEPICPVGSIQGRQIFMANPCWDNSNRRSDDLVGYGQLSSPAYIENAYELLSRPGQFYLDPTEHRLYYIPRVGERMSTADVEVPAIQQLVVGAGRPNSPIENITFANLEFAYATWTQPSTPQGFSEIQAGFTLTKRNGFKVEGLCRFAKGGTCPYAAWTQEPGNVQLTFDRDVRFVNDRFVHLGAASLLLGNGSQNDLVQGSVFCDVSGDGIQLGGVNRPEVGLRAQTLGNQIVNNHIFNIGAEYHGAVAILAGYTANTRIEHNQIDHVPYTGISMGWGGWADKIGVTAVPNYSRDNIIAHNRIFDFLQILADGGGIYTQGITGHSMASGEQVLDNVIYNQFAWGRALQSDDGATYITYRGNVMYDDNYDYGDSRFDARLLKGHYDHQLVEGNFWQQGDLVLPNIVQSHNQIIAGPAQAPPLTISEAGMRPNFQYTLWWRPSGERLPSAPDQVAVLYAFDGRAWVTWHPSIGGAFPTSYVVRACLVGASRSCMQEGQSVTISNQKYLAQGYAVVRGLRVGSSYTFVVTAKGRQGKGTLSIPSAPQRISTVGATIPGEPSFVGVQAGPHNVRVIWWPPDSIKCSGFWWAPSCRGPLLDYLVTSSTGKSYMVAGLRGLIVWNKRGRTLAVIGGLNPNKSYSFSVAAVTPAGIGPARSSAPIKPLKE